MRRRLAPSRRNSTITAGSFATLVSLQDLHLYTYILPSRRGPMPTSHDETLNLFAKWLSSLGEDAESLVGSLEASAGWGAEGGDSLSPEARRSIAGGLSYLLRSLDLIPDGMDDI